MTTHEKLLEFAYEVAYPYLLKLDFIQPYINVISFLLVGSTATGLCGENSDVDICLLCREDIFNKISNKTDWRNGRPTGLIIDNIQLHYYAISYDSVAKKLSTLDDVAFYVYGRAIPLNDNPALFSKLQLILSDEELNVKRKEQALDILTRRRRALQSVLNDLSDPIIRIDVCNEILKHILQATAIKDNMAFDTRKRPYITGLSGETGILIKNDFNSCIALLSRVSNMEDNIAKDEFAQLVDSCIEKINSTHTQSHYDLLIDEGNDPVRDPVPLQEYMDKWDGQAFIDELKLAGKENLLEIGVGTGRLAQKALNVGCCNFTGIDISPKTIDRAKENLERYSNVKLICADFMEYDFKEQFDVIYSSLTFMHIEEKLNAISKVATLLKTGGRFVLSIDKNPGNVIDMSTRKIDIYPDNADDIYKFIKAARLKLIKQFDTEFAIVFVAEKV